MHQASPSEWAPLCFGGLCSLPESNPSPDSIASNKTILLSVLAAQTSITLMTGLDKWPNCFCLPNLRYILLTQTYLYQTRPSWRESGMIAKRTTSFVVDRRGLNEGMTCLSCLKDRQNASREFKVKPLLASTFTCAAQTLGSAPAGIGIVWTLDTSVCTFGALGVHKRPDKVATLTILMSMLVRWPITKGTRR